NTFLRLMGVYPPGSLVQLSDDRYALVISVSPSRPLKPRVIIHTPGVAREEAREEDLADLPEIGIRRALKPLQLPKASMDYLSPRQRFCYFFERAPYAELGGANP
ncbi:MAG TPA: HD-GYP domain-containing protein, partial [Rhodocyclaceae bacterium]|nr:HD-GYP domain-containing protein [Rhodocyclaceae bacterium]